MKGRGNWPKECCRSKQTQELLLLSSVGGQSIFVRREGGEKKRRRWRSGKEEAKCAHSFSRNGGSNWFQIAVAFPLPPSLSLSLLLRHRM